MRYDNAGESNRYYAKFTFGQAEEEKEQRVAVAAKEALEGGQAHDMDPIIYIRAHKAAPNAFTVLPSIKLTDFFQVSEGDQSIAFSVQRKVITEEDLASKTIRDEASKKFFADVIGFTPDQDAQLVQ